MQNPIVAILLPTLQIGGAEKVLIELANGLAGRGLSVHLLVMKKEGPLCKTVQCGVEIFDLGSSSYRMAAFKLAIYYKKSRPAIILSSMYATGLVAIIAKFLSRHKPKVIVGAHNSLRSKVTRPDNPKDKILLLPLCKFLFPFSDCIVAVSDGVAIELRELIRIQPHRVQTIYNPVISSSFAAKASELVNHPWLEQSGDRSFKTIVAIGRLVEQKGFDLLLPAFKESRRNNDHRLIIIGDGPLRKKLGDIAENLGIKNFIDFIGWESNPYKYLSRADLFVLSSRWEGLPTVLIEALACGCPIVSTNCKFGPSEILENGTHGDLVEVGSIFDLSAKISRTLESSRCTEAAIAARRDRALQFTIETAVGKYLRLFTELDEGNFARF